MRKSDAIVVMIVAILIAIGGFAYWFAGYETMEYSVIPTSVKSNEMFEVDYDYFGPTRSYEDFLGTYSISNIYNIAGENKLIWLTDLKDVDLKKMLVTGDGFIVDDLYQRVSQGQTWAQINSEYITGYTPKPMTIKDWYYRLFKHSENGVLEYYRVLPNTKPGVYKIGDTNLTFRVNQ